MMKVSIDMKFICLFMAVLIFLSCPISVLAEESTEVDPDDWEVNSDGFWNSVFWGTESDPGIIRKFFNWFLDLVNGFYGTLIDGAIKAFNISPESFDTIKYYFELAESWIPISYTFTMLFAYWTFLASFVGVKFVLKMLPWIG